MLESPKILQCADDLTQVFADKSAFNQVYNRIYDMKIYKEDKQMANKYVSNTFTILYAVKHEPHSQCLDMDLGSTESFQGPAALSSAVLPFTKCLLDVFQLVWSGNRIPRNPMVDQQFPHQRAIVVVSARWNHHGNL